MLLDDTQSDEPKSLIEEKLKKVTTERAPVVGAVSARGDRSRDREDRDAASRLGGTRGLFDSGNPLFGNLDPQTPGGPGSGAAAAAGVLTAVDEDEEGDEEATVPNDFDYFSDAGSDEDEE